MKFSKEIKKKIKDIYHYSLGNIDQIFDICDFIKCSRSELHNHIDENSKYYEVEKLQEYITYNMIHKFKDEYIKYGYEINAEKYFELMFDFQIKQKKNNISNNKNTLLQTLYNSGLAGITSSIIEFLKLTVGEVNKNIQMKTRVFHVDEFGNVPDDYLELVNRFNDDDIHIKLGEVQDEIK